MLLRVVQNQRNKRLGEYIIVVAILMVFEIAIMLRYQYRLAFPYYLITLASMSLLPGMIFFVTSSKVRFILYSVLIFFGFIFFVTNTCLFYYKEDIFALAMLVDVGDGLKMGIKYNIFIAFNLWQWILIILSTLVSIIALFIMSYGKNYTKTPVTKRSAFVLLMAFFVLLFATSFIQEKDVRVYDTPQDKRTYLTTFGMTTFTQRDFFKTIGSYLSKKDQLVRANELIQQIDHDTYATQSDVFGTLANKNVIMLMLETVEEYAVDPVLTPTLYKLLYGGYHFNNTYGVAKTNYTYDAEFKSLTSMMYYHSSNLMHTYAQNEFTNALPFVLRQQGYTANSFHSFDRNYFNRDQMHQALGFERFYAYDEMIFSPVDYWPLDSEFLSQMADDIAPIQDELFFSFVITLSTHGAYVERRSEFAPYYDLIEADGRFASHEEEFINYLAAHIDLDRGLQALVESLESKNLADDTIIVMFSDHKNYSSPEITKKYKTNVEMIYDYDRIPFSIYHPGLTATSINTITSQYDIMPTILDLLGISVIQGYYYGQSVFLADHPNYVSRPIILGYNRWITNDMIVFDKEIIAMSDAIVDVDAHFINIQENVFQTIETFHALFLTDYFRKTAID